MFLHGLILTTVRILTLVSLVLLAAGSAHADNTAQATKLFEEGFALQQQGKYAEACAKFTQSFELYKKDGNPAAGVQLNLGECVERDGQLRKAYVLFDDAAQEYTRRAKAAEAALAKDPNSAELKRDLDRANAGVKVARQKADTVALKLGKVVVRIAEPSVAGLAIKIGDRAVAPSPEIIEYLDTGSVTITVTAPNREAFTTSARAEAGKQVVVEIPSLKMTGATGPVVKPETPSTPMSPRRKRVLLAFGVGGAGVVVLGVSTVLGLGAKSDYDDAIKNCDTSSGSPVCMTDAEKAAADDAASKADKATIVGVIGIAMIATGAVLYFTAPKESAMTIAPMASPTGAGVSISGRF